LVIQPTEARLLSTQVMHGSGGECASVGEGLICQVMRFEIVPNQLDVIEFFRRMAWEAHSTVNQLTGAALAFSA
jgi:hypothetical protein